MFGLQLVGIVWERLKGVAFSEAYVTGDGLLGPRILCLTCLLWEDHDVSSVLLSEGHVCLPDARLSNSGLLHNETRSSTLLTCCLTAIKKTI